MDIATQRHGKHISSANHSYATTCGVFYAVRANVSEGVAGRGMKDDGNPYTRS
jgi:hypothetical protein